MPISPHFQSIHQKEWEINFTQCDPSGKLKYPDLCNLLQLTAAEHAEMGGISFTDMQVHQQAWVLSRIRIEIDQMPRWRDRILCKTWIVSLENSRSIRAMEIYLNDTKIIGAESFWAVFNTQKRRPEPLALPHHHFEKYETQRATKLPFSKIEIPSDAQPIHTQQVKWSDLDIVHHANHVKYLEWCLDANAKKLALHQSIDVLEMNFLSELNLHDALVIHETEIDNEQRFAITKGDKICFVARLDWK